MSFETPQDYLAYFQHFTLSADPPATKWSVGLQAAQLWTTYHEQATRDPELLIELIQTLMPYRFAGSGFHAFWLTVLYHVRTLPVEQQVPLWRAIFDPANHGEQLLRHLERVDAIMQHWKDIIQQSEHIPIDANTIQALVRVFGPDLAPDHEWLSLAYAINTWIEAHLTEPSFLELIFEQHSASNKH